MHPSYIQYVQYIQDLSLRKIINKIKITQSGKICTKCCPLEMWKPQQDKTYEYVVNY